MQEATNIYNKVPVLLIRSHVAPYQDRLHQISKLPKVILAGAEQARGVSARQIFWVHEKAGTGRL